MTPPIAAQQGILGTVHVVVSLDADSRVVGTRIQSSPSAVLNAAALAAARQSTFQAEVRGCRPIAGDYIYSVDFEPVVMYATTSSGERTVSAVGQGVVRRAPDAAIVLARIVTPDDVPANATAKNDAAFGALKAKLATLGIDDNKIHWTWSGPNGNWSTSAREVEITVGSPANAGHVAAAVASLGSPVDTVAIRYALNDRTAAFDDALRMALKDAENSARGAVMDHLGALKHVTVVPKDRTRAPTAIVPYHLVPVIGGIKEPDVRIPEIAVYASATVTYSIKP